MSKGHTLLLMGEQYCGV